MNYLTSLLKELVAKRKLIWELSKADFRKRFVGSYFGVVWMFIQPIVTVLIYWLIFGPIGFKSAPPVPNASYVSKDETAGARTALRYLRGLGHEKILFVRGAKSDSYRVKEEAYRELMTEDGLFDERYVVNIGAGNSLHTVDTTMNLLMELLPDCEATAALCCNDLMGVGVLNACKRLGIRVPEQMSIMGYDNTSLSRFVEPKLTTMDQNMLILGSNAAELLIEKIETGRSKKVVLENILVPRETTGPRRG